MGPSRTRDHKLPAQDDLLREKDSRIATLETRLEAYSARASTAQVRLLKTIDVLDALRAQHALDIAAEEQAKRRLGQEATHWRRAAGDLEVERDALKDVVEDLIEKVAFTSPSMQRGNLNVAFPEQVPAAVIGTIDGPEDSETRRRDDHNDDDLLAFATSITARLRMELDVERQNHGRTVQEANLRIEELEAKVAVREAELEACMISPGDDAHPPAASHPVSTRAVEKHGKRLPEPKPLSDDQCLQFLESNSARNRSLEIEIRQIAERLEQARLATETQSPAPRHGRSHIPTPRTRSASVDPNALSRPSNAPVPGSPSTMLSIVQLDNQIRTKTTQMDALVSERTTLIDAAARHRRVTDGMNMDAFQDILRVEGDCVRLQAEVDDLREQLQQARSFARARERVLLREIAQLRASSSETSALPPAQDLHPIFSPQPLEADITAEESMELASPLMPTTIVPDPPPGSHPPDNTDADLISLPVSPSRRAFSEAPPTPPCHTRRSPSTQDIERVQVALDVARMHLAQKEEALVQLRAEMERLQQASQTQTQGDGNGG